MDVRAKAAGPLGNRERANNIVSACGRRSSTGKWSIFGFPHAHDASGGKPKE